jgi:hypothetical protein
MLPTKCRYIWPIGFREDLKKSSNQKQELSVVAMFVNGSGQNVQSLEQGSTLTVAQLPRASEMHLRAS